MTKWTEEWPAEPGRYWFYGQPYWGATEYPPRLYSVRVYSASDSRLHYLADGSYIHRGDAKGVWRSAVLPEPPCHEGGK